MCKLLLCLLLILHYPPSKGFLPSSSLIGKKSFASRPEIIRFVLKRSTEADQTDGTEISKAITALEDLVEQQKADLRATEQLIKVVRERDALDPETQSTAASLLAGFDYGFVSRSEGQTTKLQGGLALDGLRYGGPPANVLTLGSLQFVRNWEAIQGEYKDEEDVELTEKQEELQAQLEKLTLNSTKIWEREFADGDIEAPLIIKIPYLAVCFLLDVVFEGRYVPSRFFLLETVARMPYFSYISMLHLYETLGFWRRSADMKRVHFAEEINEYNHLLIMESLGGDHPWWVRCVAQHSAIVYYFVLCLLWAISPSLSYRFSELLETHAVNTYGVFLDDNVQLLQQLPPSMAAVEYYTFGLSDAFYAEFQTSGKKVSCNFVRRVPALSYRYISTQQFFSPKPRKPGANMRSLYDVFSAIRADETDHVNTMQACLDPQATVRTPSLERKVIAGLAFVAVISALVSTGDIGTIADMDTAAENVASADMGIDAAAAGAAFAGSAMAENEEFASLAFVEGTRRVIVQVLETLARFFL